VEGEGEGEGEGAWCLDREYVDSMRDGDVGARFWRHYSLGKGRCDGWMVIVI
jgi:hypothetical protein